MSAKYNEWQLILAAFVLCIATTPFFQNEYPFEGILRETGIFAYLCPETAENDCELRESAFVGLTVAVTAAGSMSAAIGGIILDHWGAKFAAMLGFAIQITGFIILSVADDRQALLFVALPLIGGGAAFSFYGFFPIAELFPRRRHLIIGIMGGFRCLGLANVFIVQALVINGHSLSHVATSMGFLILFTGILVFTLLPNHFLADFDQTLDAMLLSPLMSPTSLLSPVMSLRDPVKDEEKVNGFINSAVSRKFWPFLYFVCSLSLICNWFDITVDRAEPTLALAYSILLPLTCFLSPLLGHFIDILGPFTIHDFLTYVVIALQVFKLFPHEWVESSYVQLVFICVLRAYLDSQWISFVGAAFPAKYAGRLTGVAYMAIGFTSLALGPMWDYSRDIASFAVVDEALVLLALTQ
eukprot:Blabericola_migrator_1__12482@NODE_78_length_15130_cov_126_174401_g70_i0_p5_GENE_NODE_78_length_15130_cov_126_174401_g70_i0NODE_78_length_15130_cov_126_174401_g70_i0_p5_ORF_typecomplete_len412_score49_34MFS_1/PF07690_16/4_8e07Nodulinlike/PF06813_13/2_7e05Nodulinlike/PF06813_13/4_2e03Nodulinlike/PF06813_13/1e03_NODE_78_length_15130_cov_126_174401_g70_i032684503